MDVVLIISYCVLKGQQKNTFKNPELKPEPEAKALNEKLFEVLLAWTQEG